MRVTVLAKTRQSCTETSISVEDDSEAKTSVYVYSDSTWQSLMTQTINSTISEDVYTVYRQYICDENPAALKLGRLDSI